MFAAIATCGQPESGARDLPPNDPYIQARYAMMNYGACRLVRPDKQLASAERQSKDEAIAQAERDLQRFEVEAKARGYGEYLDSGQRTFVGRVRQELHVGCRPNEIEAMHAARDSFDRLRAHIRLLDTARQ